MRAINDYIVVNVEKVGPKKVGGLLLTEELDESNRYIKAKIISTGNLVEGLKDHDIIYYDKHAGHGNLGRYNVPCNPSKRCSVSGVTTSLNV